MAGVEEFTGTVREVVKHEAEKSDPVYTDLEALLRSYGLSDTGDVNDTEPGI